MSSSYVTTVAVLAALLCSDCNDTYDQASIRRWVKNGCRTCPVTGEKLCSADVVPNITVRGIVEQVLLSNGVSLHEPSSRHRCTVDKMATPFGAVAFIVGEGTYCG
ncbi:hypothetical protein E2562_033223 [Oryza meyeriana var. granulata]|uniref:U-box domain-containing protein n=1 Tax=Oryza meyeriana var. granulata TaxID=110450 RepID=A0A6G1BQZ4_9ORYZ|nr:hypothetical protein E2562_033223 [Oryza meyeriana var. granulata]